MSRLRIIIKKTVPKSELFYPMMLKQMTDEETKEYHLKRLFDMSIKWREKNPPEKPNKERDDYLIDIAFNGFGGKH